MSKHDQMPMHDAGAGAFVCQEVAVHLVNVEATGNNEHDFAIKTNKFCGLTNVMMHAYLCPHCDDTHFVVTDFKSRIAFNFAFSPEQAEKLANTLVNPVPART